MIILKTSLQFQFTNTMKPFTLIFASLNTQNSACHSANTHTGLLNELIKWL